jgi:hypothetical protein
MFQPFMKTMLVFACFGKGISNDLWEVDRLLLVTALVVASSPSYCPCNDATNVFEASANRRLDHKSSLDFPHSITFIELFVRLV